MGLLCFVDAGEARLVLIVGRSNQSVSGNADFLNTATATTRMVNSFTDSHKHALVILAACERAGIHVRVTTMASGQSSPGGPAARCDI